MDIKIIPTILPYTVDELLEKMNRIEEDIQRVQVDIIGRAFSSDVTIGVEELEKLSTGVAIDVQLMVRNPITFLTRCEKSGTDRVFGHVEYMEDKYKFVEDAFSLGMQAGLALDLLTPVTNIKEIVAELDAVLLMSVPAGKSGQNFNKSVLNKIIELRELSSDLSICIDGGINPQTIGKCVDSGANEFAVNSFLWESNDIEEAMSLLLEGIR
jgi:ribulose-phosphate 3-epimerase